MGELADNCPKLFHYTTVDAFKSIYRSGSFWATHYQDLNDRSELQCFRRIATKHAFPIMKKMCRNEIGNNAQFSEFVRRVGGIENAVSQELEKLLDIFYANMFGERGFPGPFISCFCAHKDKYSAENGLLSQWRGYGAGGGVAIVLDTLAVEKRMEQERSIFSHEISHIGDVIYDRHIKKIKTVHRDFFDLFEKYLTERYSNGPNLKQILKNILKPLIMGSTLVKHHAFREEAEVRIVVSPKPTAPSSNYFERKHPSKPTKAIKYRRNWVSPSLT